MPLGWLARVARRAARRLRIRQPGIMTVTFLDSRAMRRVNQRFLRHRGLTDVVCFRYDLPAPPLLRVAKQRVRGQAGREPVIGEILVSPACGRAYAKAHRLSYRQELARYVVHGLLHWKGYDDRTPLQQRRMRALEDRLLAAYAT